ncbi:MAG TPA: catalase family peroxidase [Candidatus Acidoferrum sp.]|jgi:catalase|nr:catalase family peroxidase [Candidatus Acidoferrum sp.]
MSASAASNTVVTQLVETLRALAGSHPGFRAAHAKGIVCAGTFRPSADARRMTRAAHLQGGALPTIVRFSNSSGNPEAHDGQPSVRAMSVKFQLADGKAADILANSIDGFVARTPEEFLEFLRAQLPDPATGKPVADAVPKFLGSRPGAAAFVGRLMQKPVPASYAQASYHAEHAFLFTAADGSRRFGRYHFVPEAGEAFLSAEDGGKRSANFLTDELRERLRGGPIAFRLQLQLAGAGDPTDDPTVLWPADRPRVELGRLEITGISATSAEDERRLVFDPANRTDGIELSNDPVLLARSAAYAISYERRSRGQ